MNYEVDGNIVMNVETVTTPNQIATIKTFYDMVYHIELTTDKAAIKADGTDTATITATLKDYLNNPYAYNGLVVFEVDGVQNQVQAVNGVATTTLTSGTTGEIKVTTNNQDMRNGEVIVNAS